MRGNLRCRRGHRNTGSADLSFKPSRIIPLHFVHTRSIRSVTSKHGLILYHGGLDLLLFGSSEVSVAVGPIYWNFPLDVSNALGKP
jgi:hypothetical protein